MYNIVLYRELESAGVSTRTIKQAQECCLLKLCNGVYSVTSECGVDGHRRIAHFIEDSDWTERHRTATSGELWDDFTYRELLRRLRIRYYPHYRDDDVIWGASAAMLHRIPLYGIDSGPISAVHPSHYYKSREIHRSNRLIAPPDHSRQSHLDVTTPIRTGLDLIHLRGQQSGFAAMEFVLRQALFALLNVPNLKYGYPPEFTRLAREELVEHWHPAIGRLTTGQRTAQRMADALNPKSESIAESYCSFNLHALNLGGLNQQVTIFDDAGFVSRNDFVHEATMTILEVDGLGKYVKVGRELMHKESVQHNRLLALGYTIVRFRFKELLNLSMFSTKLFTQAPKLRKFIGAAGRS